MLTVEHLGKTFKFRGKETHAVSDLSFSLARGRTLGLLGPNGAGKTTTLRILATVSRASEGVVRIAGMDLTSEARKVRQLIGYVPQVGTLQAESVVGEELVFQGRLFGMSRASAEHRGREVLALMGAEEFWGRRAGRLSGGERRKVDIAMGMMNQPDIAFLDEPTVGLDPDARQEMWAMIRNMREKWGTTVVITTHYLDEAEDLADDILMMEGGRLIAHDSTQRLKERFAVDEVFVHLDATDVAETAWSHSGVDGVLSAEYSGTDAGMLLSLRISDGERTLPAVLEVLHRRGQIPMRISVRRGGLQDAFFSLTGKDLLA